MLKKSDMPGERARHAMHDGVAQSHWSRIDRFFARVHVRTLYCPELCLLVASGPRDLLGVRDGDDHSLLVNAGRDAVGHING
jgi:hypothetical protein